MAVDPQVQELLDGLAALGQPPIREQTPQEARLAMAAVAALGGDPIPLKDVHEITIPVPGGSIGARVYTPDGAGARPLVVFFHGGGWVIGDLDTHDNAARAIARDAGAVVVSVDYRLAPEHRFPVAAQDCLAATQWVSEHAEELGGDSSRLAVCGDSAGGNLAAVVTQMARDGGGPAIRFAALIYPATDFTAREGSMTENASGYFLELEDMQWFEAHYLDPDRYADPLASPALGDLRNLPPAFITTCEYDPLRDQGEAYGAALRAAGGDAEVKRYDGQIHGVINMAGVLDGGRQMLADVADRLQRALH